MPHLKYIVILFAFFLISCKTGSVKEGLNTSHLGEWSGVTSKGQKMRLSLKKDGSARLWINQKSMNPHNRSQALLYIIDYQSTPAILELVFMKKNQESEVIRMLIEFQGSSLIKAATAFTETLPYTFTTENTFFLIKD